MSKKKYEKTKRWVLGNAKWKIDTNRVNTTTHNIDNIITFYVDDVPEDKVTVVREILVSEGPRLLLKNFEEIKEKVAALNNIRPENMHFDGRFL